MRITGRKHISRAQVYEIGEIADRHGFKLSGFRSFERARTDEQIAQVRQRAADARRTSGPVVHRAACRFANNS